LVEKKGKEERPALFFVLLKRGGAKWRKGGKKGINVCPFLPPPYGRRRRGGGRKRNEGARILFVFSFRRKMKKKKGKGRGRRFSPPHGPPARQEGGKKKKTSEEKKKKKAGWEFPQIEWGRGEKERGGGGSGGSPLTNPPIKNECGHKGRKKRKRQRFFLQGGRDTRKGKEKKGQLNPLLSLKERGG